MKNLIDNAQNAYIKNRNIAHNIRNTADLIEYANKTKNIGFILFADFEKAFDTISWSFLFKIMERLGFKTKFVAFIKIAYKDIITYVSNNGHLSAPLWPKRGLKQGDPLSSFLYLIIGEILIRKINLCKGVKGIKVGDKIFKCSQLADDTTLFLDDEESIVNSISLFKRFEEACGLKLNASKSNIIKVV